MWPSVVEIARGGGKEVLVSALFSLLSPGGGGQIGSSCKAFPAWRSSSGAEVAQRAVGQGGPITR